MSKGIGSQRVIIVAAVLLAVAGLVLVFTGGDDDGGRGGSAGVTAGDLRGEGTTAGGEGTEDGEGTPTGDTTDQAETPASEGERPTDQAETPADQDETDEPLEPTDTPTATPTPGPRPTPTLPAGMRLPEPVQVPEPATVDGTDPSAVAVAALTAVYSFDTARDATAEDAMSRAETWLAEEFRSQAYDLEGLQQDVQRDWSEWAQHQAFVSINSIEPQSTDVDPQDTPTRAERRFYVRVTPIGRDAWNGNLLVHQWFAFLGRDSATDDWKVVELQTPLAHR